MTEKTWTWTTYEDGKPVSVTDGLDTREAVEMIRAAVSGEDLVTPADREPAPELVEVAA